MLEGAKELDRGHRMDAGCWRRAALVWVVAAQFGSLRGALAALKVAGVPQLGKLEIRHFYGRPRFRQNPLRKEECIRGAVTKYTKRSKTRSRQRSVE